MMTVPNEAPRTILPIAGWSDRWAAEVAFTGGAEPVLPTLFRIGAAVKKLSLRPASPAQTPAARRADVGDPAVLGTALSSAWLRPPRMAVVSSVTSAGIRDRLRACLTRSAAVLSNLTRTDQACTSKGSGSKNRSSTLASSREMLLS